jgi:hypothetical protein
MTARAQIMLRQYSDARQTLQELLRLLPSCRAAQQLGERMTELELESPPYAGTATVLISRQEVARETGADRRLQWSHQDDILPGIEHFASRTEADEQGEDPVPPGMETTAPLFDLGDLARRLEGARIPALPEERDEETRLDEVPPIEEINLGSRPVTETLAGIYEQQGRLQEAMEGYQRLAMLQPERRDHFEMKVQELRLRLLQQQQQQQ